jgi:hypothetical protein
MPEVIQSQNLDSAQTMFFARELEAKKAATYDVIRAPLKAFELIPVSTEAGAGAETISYEQYDITGIAKIIANYADDLPRADVKGKEFFAPVKSIGNSYGYSLQEIRAAQMAGKSLEQRKSNAAARAQREKWNRIAFNGDSATGLPGWLTNANVPASPVAEGGGAGDPTEWEDKTPTEILKDLNDAVNGIIDLTNGAEQPNTVVLPIKQYTQIATTRQDSGTDTTILEYFLRNSPTITAVEWANELKGAFTGTTDGFIVYDRNPDKLTLEMPQMFEQLPVQERGLEFVVPCHSRIGGVIIYYPLSMVFKYGI